MTEEKLDPLRGKPVFYSFQHNAVALMGYDKGTYIMSTQSRKWKYSSWADFQLSDWEYVGYWN